MSQYYSRFPFACAGGAAEFASLGTWDTVQTILADKQVDVMIVRKGELLKRETPLSYDDARALHAEGATVVIRHSERHHTELHQLADDFSQAFRGRVDIHLYCTPTGQSGFGWHYDAEDVFIIQGFGSKEYSLRKNTVHPWPLVETIPRDMQYERETMPLMRCNLAAN